MKHPKLIKEHHHAYFLVKNQKLIALAGEVHNSSCSNVEYFQQHVLQVLDPGINTLLLPVYWEVIEEEEGVYDFSLVQQLIDACRKQHLHIIFLWFGLWKNALSTYVPGWMKKDRRKYPFLRRKDQTSILSITPLCKEAIEKDAAAIQAFFTFLKEYDGNEQTVIMVQLENEIGALQTDRDYGDLAQLLFHDTVPKELSDLQGTWEEVFGAQASEMFMLYHYANAIERFAQTAKRVYPIPLYVNGWQKKAQGKPGEYPSGGPHQHMVMWYQKLCPSIDLSAPDLYDDDISFNIKAYSEQGVLAIPETRQDVASLANLIYAITAYPLVLYSPFGIEDIMNVQGASQQKGDVLAMLGITKEAFQPEGTKDLLLQIYQDLDQMMPFLMEVKNSNRILAFLGNGKQNEQMIFNDIILHIQYLYPKEKTILPAGFICYDKNSYYLYGACFLAEIQGWKKEKGLLVLEEGCFVHGEWKKKRVLNGDERYMIGALHKPRMLRFEVFDMEITS